MKILSTIFLSTLLSITGYSQTEIEKTIFKPVNPNQIVTIFIDVRSYPMNDIGSLKDDLLMFDEKITLVEFNEDEMTFSFSYNENMLFSDLKYVFEQNKIDYIQNRSEVLTINLKD